ncbi:MAG: hypothetical protein ABIR71_11515 [Chthoniobacterales bacterium]
MTDTRRGRHSAKRGANVLSWLNLVCLDAPLVAISWQWLFARSFGIAIAPGGTAALFLTAWLIYLADRFGDSLSVNERSPLSERQHFCLRYRAAWVAGLVIIALADLFAIAQLDRVTLRSGVSVAAFAVLYLVLNQRWPSLWRTLPVKEISIGFLFAAGTRVGLAAGLTGSALPGWFLFACVCALNCISIAVWERELDLAQGRVSIATVFPDVRRFVPLAALLLVLLSALGVSAGPRSINACVAASAILLGALYFFAGAIQPDTRTALADLVLLTPLLALAVG